MISAKKNKGFTLIELLVVVAIIGILAAVGVDASEIYSNSIGDQSSGHLLFNLGLGAKFKNDLTINTSYEHYRSTDDAFNNNFSVYVRKPL